MTSCHLGFHAPPKLFLTGMFHIGRPIAFPNFTDTLLYQIHIEISTGIVFFNALAHVRHLEGGC